MQFRGGETMTAAEQIYALIYELVPLTISLIGFIIGMVNILKKKAPYFFTLIIFAVGCFVIEQVSLAVNTVCEIYDTIWVGALGVFGCNLFLLSANYGALDKVIDETGLTSNKKFLSLIAPTVLTVITVITFFIWKDRDMLSAVVLTLIMIPAIPASYYNIKHLLLPEDDLGLLKAIKGCDIMSLVFFFMAVVHLFAITIDSIPGIVIAEVLLALSVLGLALAAVKGVRQWKI